MTHPKSLIHRTAVAAAATAALSFAGLSAQAESHKEGEHMAENAELEAEAAQALQQCGTFAESCAANIDTAAGVLVFPEVVKANLVVGGAGGDGVLMVDNEVQGYYNIGEASVGVQVGIDEFAMVYVFQDQETLDELIDGDKWELGAAAGATVVDANADAMATTGDPAIYIFDAEGLNAELSVSALRIWEEDHDDMNMDHDDMDDEMDLDDDDDMDDMN